MLSTSRKINIYKTVILYVVFLYGFETWSLSQREEHRLRVFSTGVLRNIFVPKREEITGEERNLHNEEHHVLVLHQIVLE